MSLVIPQASISLATQVSTKKLNKRYVIVFIICAKLEKKLTKLVSLVNLGLAISIFLKRISSPKHPYKKSLDANVTKFIASDKIDYDIIKTPTKK